MTGTLLASTPKASVHALAFQGIMAYACFPQIRDMLRRKFGDDYVLLFAEPVENTQTSEIDWYTPVYGSPRKLKDLPQEQQDAVVGKLASMAKDIQDFAEELMRSPDQMKVTRGNILRLALCYPDNNYIYVCGDQPVFVCWGFGPGTPGVEPRDLTRIWAARPVPQAQASEPEPEPASGGEDEEAPEDRKEEPVAASDAPTRRIGCLVPSFGCFLWLLPFSLASLLLWLLFTSFGGLPAIAGKALFENHWLKFLEGPENRTSDVADLRAEVDKLRDQLGRHVELCTAEPPRAAASEPAVPAPEPEGEQLVIPEQVDDTRFLQGEWLCKTGLMNVKTKEPVEVLFSYDGGGHGKAVVVDKSDRCTGDATAEMRGGELVMTVEQQVCERTGRVYNRVRIICRNTEGSASSCTGVNEDGSTWQARFLKVK